MSTVKPTTTTTAPVNNIMEDLTKKQSFKKFSWRGKDINQLLAMKMPEFAYKILNKNIVLMSVQDKEDD